MASAYGHLLILCTQRKCHEIFAILIIVTRKYTHNLQLLKTRIKTRYTVCMCMYIHVHMHKYMYV